MPWTEVIIETKTSPDELLLLETVAPLVDELRPALAAWHFFWEPDLWVRLRWTDSAHRSEHEAWLERRLEGAQKEGLVDAWRFGAYAGDAEMMGEEMWARCEGDFMNSAEMALAVLRHEKQSDLSRHRGFHWARHVHTFSNPLVGTWTEEVRLCLLQARYRIRLLARAKEIESQAARLTEMVAKIEETLAGMDTVEAVERHVTSGWRAKGRPDIATLLDLPDDFHRDPGEE